MTVKFYLKDPKQTESLVVAQILWQNSQLRYTAKKIIKTAFWDKKTQRVKKTAEYPTYPEINQSLNNLENEIKKVFMRHENDHNSASPDPKTLKDLLDTHFKRNVVESKGPKIQSFIEFFDDFITKSEKGIRNNNKSGKALSINTLKTYRTAFTHLKEFKKTKFKKLDWESIDLDFHADYTEYLMHDQHLSNNAVGKDFQIIKLVCLEAYDLGINKYHNFQSKRFKVIREESDSIHLTEKEINKLWELDLSGSKTYEETRDLFVFACLTGLRYSDYSNIKKQQITDKSIHVIQAKTDEPLEIPLQSLAKKVVKKYSGILPKACANPVFNRYIKDICKKIPEFKETVEREFSKGGKRIITNKQKWEEVMAHTPRRSFATNEVAKGTSIPVIMAISGHTTEKSFWKYVKLKRTDYVKMYSDILNKRNGKLRSIA